MGVILGIQNVGFYPVCKSYRYSNFENDFTLDVLKSGQFNYKVGHVTADYDARVERTNYKSPICYFSRCRDS